VLHGIMVSLRDLLLEGRTKITADQTGRGNLELHVRIYEAIRKRQPKLAHRRMLEHLEDGRKRYEQFYQDLKISSMSEAQQLPGTLLRGNDANTQARRSPSGRSRKEPD